MLYIVFDNYSDVLFVIILHKQKRPITIITCNRVTTPKLKLNSRTSQGLFQDSNSNRLAIKNDPT